MKDILETIIKNLVENKDAIEIKEVAGEQAVVLEVKVAKRDIVKIIRKKKKIAHSIRTIMKAVASKENKRVSVEFIG